MRETILALITELRPRQWLKNLALFIPAIFSRRVFLPELFVPTLLGVIAFCFLSSSNYVVNDVLDVKGDRKDPFKKFRPIARGIISEQSASLIAFILAFLGFMLSLTLGTNFFLVAVGFVALHWASHYFLRHISVIDILALASGYLLRVVAGEVIANYHISVWLFLTVLASSLLLAIGKRRAELSLIQEHEEKFPRQPEEFIYSEKLLDAYVAVFANATFLTYSYFAFLNTPLRSGLLGDIGLWGSRKWMMLTIPFVLFGILRYLQVIYELKSGTLEQALLKDKPLLVTLGLWAITVVAVIYWL